MLEKPPTELVSGRPVLFLVYVFRESNEGNLLLSQMSTHSAMQLSRLEKHPLMTMEKSVTVTTSPRTRAKLWTDPGLHGEGRAAPPSPLICSINNNKPLSYLERTPDLQKPNQTNKQTKPIVQRMSTSTPPDSPADNISHCLLLESSFSSSLPLPSLRGVHTIP